LTYYAESLRLQGRFAEAAKKYKDVLALEPNNALAVANYPETARKAEELAGTVF
jgi:cytochrome c-type biogenesis protein CcmH/NrfG